MLRTAQTQRVRVSARPIVLEQGNGASIDTQFHEQTMFAVQGTVAREKSLLCAFSHVSLGPTRFVSVELRKCIVSGPAKAKTAIGNLSSR